MVYQYTYRGVPIPDSTAGGNIFPIPAIKCVSVSYTCTGTKPVPAEVHKPRRIYPERSEWRCRSKDGENHF
jgi:hypothetical protein